MNRIALIADAGVPMIFVTFPAMLVALVPIIVVESLLIQRRTKFRSWPIFRATAAANAVSTIFGVPLTWGALLLCEFGVGYATSMAKINWDSPIAQVSSVILSAPWIAPNEETGMWAVPLAALVLLVPFYFVSVWSERLVMEFMLPVTAAEEVQDGEVSEGKLRNAIRDANLLSYAGLVLLTFCWLIFELLHRTRS